jgi:3-carboxy-cis,cis-muconate cycloisomerase
MLIEPQFRTDVADHIWSTQARLSRMIAFEVQLAGAEAECGLIPQAAAEAIRLAGDAEGLDASAIFEAARDAGNPAIPFASAFTAHVASLDAAASRYVHFGATSQDVIDTAHMLALKVTIDHLRADTTRATDRLRSLALAHAETPIAARTLLQQATPITFGAKAAHWLLGLRQTRRVLEESAAQSLVVQLAGASGTLAVLHPHGSDVRAKLAVRLGLGDPGGNWQTARAPLLTVASALVGVIQIAAKIAGDIQFLAATEVGEVCESLRSGGGGSSAMPHKRNPVDSLVPVAALPVASGLLAGLAASGAQEQERGPGRWHAEWTIMPLLTTLALASAARLADLLDGLAIDAARMRDNLERLDGLLASEALASALAEVIGRTDAKSLSGELVARVRDERRHLRDIAQSDPRVTNVLSAETLDGIFTYRAAIAAAAADARRIAADN